MSDPQETPEGESVFRVPVGATVATHAITRLLELVGRERRLEEVTRGLRSWVQTIAAPVVGAMQLGCSDEAQHECVEEFQRNFVRYLLPSMKFFSKAAFTAASLGGRYQWGAAGIAEDHFALARGAEKWKAMVIKVDAHVSVEDGPDGPVFGRMERYSAESVYCGALHAVLEGSTMPFARDLAEDFSFEDIDRVAELLDPHRVDPKERSLLAAVTSARLQARRVLVDLQEHASRTPTLYLVVPCVTINRRRHDTELLVGLYASDHRGESIVSEYCGLGDRPSRYEVSLENRMLRITDERVGHPRRARDHRAEVLAAWRERAPAPAELDARFQEVLRETAESDMSSKQGSVAKAALGTLLLAALEFSPIPAAVVLFGSGLIKIHHAAGAHRLARQAREDEAAREMLEEIRGRVDHLSPEEARHLTDLLLAEYGRGS